jgi:hypothetical protein
MEPPPMIYPYVLPEGVPVKPKNLIFQCVTPGRTQTLILRNGGTIWFKDYCWGGGKQDVWKSEEEIAWERLEPPKEAEWRRFRSKLEELKVWESKKELKPEDPECGGYVDYRIVLGFPDRMIRLRGALKERACGEYEDEEGNETVKFDHMFQMIARAFERLTGREWFYE